MVYLPTRSWEDVVKSHGPLFEEFVEALAADAVDWCAGCGRIGHLADTYEEKSDALVITEVDVCGCSGNTSTPRPVPLCEACQP